MGHRSEHLRFHTGEKPQVSKVWHGVCWPWCTNKSCKDTQKRPNIFYMKIIMRNPELQSHQAIHSDIRPHNCSMSDATFKRRQELRLHILKHTGEKPLICTKCEKKKKNLTLGELKSHLKTHYQVRSFSCSQCDMAFVYLQGLNGHKTIQ